MKDSVKELQIANWRTGENGKEGYNTTASQSD